MSLALATGSPIGPRVAERVTLASAKWGAPEISRVYARKRLLERLDRSSPFPCTWVAAPAGYGKTCLARAYLDRKAVPSLWYTLERSDSDVASFLADFGAGLSAALPAAPLLQYSSDIQDPTAFARAYFKRAFAHIRGPHLLVLDDYQEVAPDSPLHAVIAAAIGALPRDTRLIVLSREVPPGPLARAQTYDLVACLGAEDLRLTPAEGLAMARLRAPHHDLGEQTVQTLLERTDGWAAGFVLLLCHPTEALPPSDTVELLFEYFAREVLGGADVELRNFLLLTAWLPSMTAEMARRLTGHPQVESLLHRLLRGNYFLSRTPAPEPVYRYHQLFRLFLLHQARAAWSQDEQAQCRRQAATLLEEADQLDAAAALWRDAGDWGSLSGLICRAAPRLLAQARTQTLDGWLAGIPAATVAERPFLLYWSGRSLLHRDPIAARGLFEQAYVSFKGAQNAEGLYLAWAGVCETYWIALDGTEPLRHWLAELESIQAQWPSFPSAEIETRVAFGAFYGLIANDPGHPRRDLWESRLLTALDTDLPPDLRLTIANLLMFHYVWTMGDRGRAALVLGRLRVLAADAATAPLNVIIASTWGGFAYEYCFGGPMERCQRIAEEARAAASERGAHLYDSILLGIPACAHLTAGRFVEARPYLQEILGILDSTRLYDRGLFYYMRAWEAWLDGRLAEARETAQTCLATATHFGDMHPPWQTTLALFQIELSLGNRALALRHLASMRHWLRRVRSRLARFEWTLALAQLALESGRAQRCRRLLRTAFALGREEGYVSVPFFKPETLARLCAQALDASIEVDYARDLIRKRALTPPSGALLGEHWPWPIKVTTLGGLTLWVNDAPVQWPRKAQHKPIDLLNALIAYGGRRVPSHRLIDDLWPDAEGDAAASAFKTTLHRLRRLLGRDDALQLRDGQVSLDPACVWVDRWALAEVLEDVSMAAPGTPSARAPEELESMSQRLFSLYKGRFLEKSDLQCAAKPREVLHRKYLLAIERLGARFETLGMPGKALSCYEHALDVDPTAERLYQRLASCTNDLHGPARPERQT